MTARHPFSENTLQRRNHRPPRETHSAQAVETPFAKKCRKTRWRVRRSEASAQERPATEEIVTVSGSERQNTKSGIARAGFGKRRRIYKSSDAFFFWKFGRPLVPGLPATACPGSGKVPANTRRHRLRKASSPRTRTVFRFRNENTTGRKNGRARHPPRSECGRPLYFHRLAKPSLQRTKHRGDIPQHIRDPLFLLPVSSALQAAPDHFDFRPRIPPGTRSSIVPSIASQSSQL